MMFGAVIKKADPERTPGSAFYIACMRKNCNITATAGMSLSTGTSGTGFLEISL